VPPGGIRESPKCLKNKENGGALAQDNETFEELEEFLARERGRLRTFGIRLFVGGLVSVVVGLGILFVASWAGPLLVAVALFLVGVGIISAIRASFILFTDKDEMVGLHLSQSDEEKSD